MEVNPVIEVVPYDPRWPKAFEQEAEKLKGFLGNSIVSIYHIGSTAVPGLAAKPIIDIMIVVKDILDVDSLIPQFEQLGYVPKGEYGMPFRRYFQKGDFLHTHHIHIFEEGSPEVDRHLAFLESLRSNTTLCQEYEILKLALAKLHPRDLVAYCEGKEEFIDKVSETFPAKKPRLILAFTQSEWDTVQAFRKQSGTLEPLEKDHHSHLLLELGPEAIGYADIHIRALALLVMKKDFESFKEEFLRLLSRWLSHQTP